MAQVADLSVRAHDLLLTFAGRIDDDALADARELLASAEVDRTLEFLVGCLIAGRIPIGAAQHAELDTLYAQTYLDRTLFNRVVVDDASAAVRHRFGGGEDAGHGVPEAAHRVLDMLPDVRSVWAVWRMTPAGAASGPVPHRVVLVGVGPGGFPTATSYRLEHALRRVGIRASVEALRDGTEAPEYHHAAMQHANQVPVVPAAAIAAAPARPGIGPAQASLTRAPAVPPPPRSPMSAGLDSAPRTPAVPRLDPPSLGRAPAVSPPSQSRMPAAQIGPPSRSRMPAAQVGPPAVPPLSPPGRPSASRMPAAQLGPPSVPAMPPPPPGPPSASRMPAAQAGRRSVPAMPPLPPPGPPSRSRMPAAQVGPPSVPAMPPPLGPPSVPRAPAAQLGPPSVPSMPAPPLGPPSLSRMAPVGPPGLPPAPPGGPRPPAPPPGPPSMSRMPPARPGVPSVPGLEPPSLGRTQAVPRFNSPSMPPSQSRMPPAVPRLDPPSLGRTRAVPPPSMSRMPPAGPGMPSVPGLEPPSLGRTAPASSWANEPYARPAGTNGHAALPGGADAALSEQEKHLLRQLQEELVRRERAEAERTARHGNGNGSAPHGWPNSSGSPTVVNGYPPQYPDYRR